jgi:hypothetical protein
MVLLSLFYQQQQPQQQNNTNTNTNTTAIQYNTIQNNIKQNNTYPLKEENGRTQP